jgi:hydrogenase-4 component B
MFIIKLLIATVFFGIILTSLCARSRRLCGAIGVLTVAVIAGILFSVAYRVFTTGPLILPQPIFAIPSLGAGLSVSVDHLSALFLILIGLISLLATLYSYRYMEIYPHQSLARFYHCLILFIAGMIGVVSVSDMFFFFVFWEFMTLSSYFLVIYEMEDPVSVRAGFKYFIMTHIGTVAMFIGAILLQTEVGSFAFSRLREAMAAMIESNSVRLSFILALFLLGFGTKAGMYPVGTWLPDAHPAAPSGISAILSGVMIKMGVYGFLRLFFFLLPFSNVSMAYGIIIAAFGALSLFMGTLSALMQHDSKRLLAFHSIGQIGYILLGIGTGLAFLQTSPVLSAVATMAGMYHALNHAIFKGLLFLNAGSILYKTGTRDLNQLGGLYSVMPATAWVTLIASFSIAGMPPFNGFVSKWLIYQATIIGGVGSPVFILFGLLAIFISAVTLASFIKFFSASFGGVLGKKLETLLRPGFDVPSSMRFPQNILALLCLLLGIFPWIPLHFIYNSLTGSEYGAALAQFTDVFGGSALGLTLVMGGVEGSGVWLPIVGLGIFGICLWLAFYISSLGKAGSRRVPIWNCGEVYEPDEVRYRAGSFYLPFVSRFEHLVSLGLPSIHLKRPDRIYRGLDFDQRVYYPFVDSFIRLSQMFRKTHLGIPQTYMLFQVVGIVLVGVAILWLSLM